MFLGAVFFLSSATQAADPSELNTARELHQRGERAAALVHYRAFLDDPTASDADRATALNNVCVLLHDLGEVQQALDACEEALILRRELGDDRPLSRTLNNLGLVLQSSGRYAEARTAYLEALRSNRDRGDDPAVAVNLANLGLLAGDEGRYGLALERHLEVEALADRFAGEPWADEQRRVAWINRGVVFEKLGAFDQALELYQRLVAEEQQLGPRRWATVQLNLGTVYRNLGDPHQAAAAYRRAATIFEREGDRAALSSARLNLGQVLHSDLRQLDEAKSELRRALALSQEAGDRGVEIQALFLLGDLYLEQDAEAAHRSFARCLELARSSGSAEGEWWALYGLGRLAERDQQPDEALEHLTSAIAVLERTRARVADRQLRGGFFAGWRHVYETAVDVLWQRRQEGDAVEAFSLVQRAKERELVEALGGETRSSAGIELAPMKIALAGLDPSGEATLLEFFVTRESLYVFRLDARLDAADADLRWWRSDLGVVRTARTAHEALAAGGSPTDEELRPLAEPMAETWANGAAKRLVVAPDGALRYLPFEILPVGSSERLVDRHIVSYLPSASAHRAPKAEATATRYRFVGLADPVLDPVRAGGLFTSRFVLERLPSGRREIDDAARRLAGEHLLLTGAEATLAALRAAVAEGVQVLHLAAHTVIDERPGGGAAVLLAPDPSGDENSTDGLLGPSDLARLNLRTGLTVLAACRTALPSDIGDETGGGSAFGSLTGSFLAAGSDAVLATLWEVGDEATEVFMQQFYYELARGRAPARALADVKRRLAADPRWGAPHLWSAYVLVGHSAPVAAPRVGGLRSMGLLFGAVLLTGGLAWILGRVLRRLRPPRTSR